MRGARIVGAALVTAAFLVPGALRAGDGHELHSGAIGVGAHGAFASVEGSTSGSLGLDAAHYRTLSALFLRYGLGLNYVRVADLDALGFSGSVAAIARLGDSSSYPFVGLAAETRQEWVGSFSQTTFPVGIDAGLVALAGTSASFSVAYRFRRVLDDPVSNYNEHRVVFGVAMLFRNR